MDILIPLGAGSRFENLELRYCLRSIEKHLSGVDNIFIIGECPSWLRGVVHIPLEESPDSKHRAHNIYSKIMAGIKSIEDIQWYWDSDTLIKNKNAMYLACLSDNFLFMNDDHFLLTDFEASKFPYYHRGTIQTHRVGNEAQRIQMENTVKRIRGEVYDFGVHCPIIYNKERFQFVFGECITNEWPDYGYEIKSMYANSIIDTTHWVPCEDLKFSEPLMKESIYMALEGRPWFSTGDKVLKSGGMQEVLQELYSEKSKYEI